MVKVSIASDLLEVQHRARYRAPLRSRLLLSAAFCGHASITDNQIMHGVEIYRRNRDHGRPQFDLADARKSSRFHPVSTLDEVFEVALLPADKPMDTPKQIMEEGEERAERQKKGKSGKRAVA